MPVVYPSPPQQDACLSFYLLAKVVTYAFSAAAAGHVSNPANVTRTIKETKNKLRK